MKIFKTYKIQALAAIMAALCYSSCSDKWDEHYGENSEGIVNATLWEAISGNADLTNFAKVAKACGYDLALDGSQTFTVFAPTNSSLSAEQADSLVNLYTERKAEGVKTAGGEAVSAESHRPLQAVGVFSHLRFPGDDERQVSAILLIGYRWRKL